MIQSKLHEIRPVENLRRLIRIYSANQPERYNKREPTNLEPSQGSKFFKMLFRVLEKLVFRKSGQTEGWFMSKHFAPN